MGRRSCMGYKMVQYIAFSLVANLLQNFTISCPEPGERDLPLGMLALPPTPFYLMMQKRVETSTVD
jgi:cytochrome P450 family 307 subfamily A